MNDKLREIRELSRQRVIYIIDNYCEGNRMDFCAKTGIGKSSVSQYVNGTNTLGNITASKIGEAFHINPMWVMGFDVPMGAEHTGMNSNRSGRQIPVYGRVAAGIPIEAVENIIDFEEIPNDWSGEYGCLVIKGDSMAPRILDGDRVIVRRQDDAESGDIVIALVGGNDGVCKRLIKYEGGIALQSFNPAYEPMLFSEESQVIIWGKVVELRGKM